MSKRLQDIAIIISKELRDSSPWGKRVYDIRDTQGQKKGITVKIGQFEEEKPSQIVSEAKPELGMTVEQITPEITGNLGLSDTSGVVIVQVEDNTPATEAGLAQGDIILEVDQVPVKNLGELNRKFNAYKVGDTVLFLINRQGATLYPTLNVWG